MTKVLIRVQREDEAEIRRAFERAVTVRKLSPEARDLADMYFFETLVRVHRAAEAAPYIRCSRESELATRKLS